MLGLLHLFTCHSHLWKVPPLIGTSNPKYPLGAPSHRKRQKESPAVITNIGTRQQALANTSRNVQPLLLLNHILLITQGLDTRKYCKWGVLPSCYSELSDWSCLYLLTEQSELLLFAALIYFLVETCILNKTTQCEFAWHSYQLAFI